MSSAADMRAMRASGPDPATLAEDRIPVPVPRPGEVLVRVGATAITAQELTWPESWPAIPCHDLSGVVAGTAPDVTGWHEGDEVFALIGFDRPGAAADYVTVPAGDLAARPPVASHAEAAVLPLGALTAWQALHDHAGAQPGQHVLVHGGAGGVGGYAVQLAADLPARVTATAAPRDAAYVTGLGAGQVIDYASRFEDQVHDVDVVVDPVGGETMARSFAVLKPGGILIAIAEPPQGHGGRDDVRSHFFVVEPSGAQLAALAALAGQGRLRPALSAVFPLAELAAAFAAQHARTRPGKIAVEVG